MAVSPFINLFRTKNEALYFKDSIINTQFIFSGVQLLPNNPDKYIQLTETPSGIDLEDWQVNVVDLCKGTKTDITSYFFVDSLTNSLDGSPQLFWSLTNVPFDFGYRLVYLEVNQIAGESFYSTPFLLTEIEKEKVSLFHYRDSKFKVFQSIGLQVYYLDEDKKTDLTTYYEVSSQTTVSKAIKTNKIDIYRTALMPKNVLILLTDVLESAILYINKNRFSLFEAIALPPKTSQENYASFDVQLSPKIGDVLTDDIVIVIPVDILPYLLTFNDGTNAEKTSNIIPFVINAILTNQNVLSAPATVEVSANLGVSWESAYNISNTNVFNSTLDTSNQKLWVRVRNTNLAGTTIYSNILKAKTL